MQAKLMKDVENDELVVSLPKVKLTKAYTDKDGHTDD